jgi:hypothetical protein
VVNGEVRVSVAFPATLPGVARLDDWDGFGQRRNPGWWKELPGAGVSGV